MKLTQEMEEAGDRVIYDWDSHGRLEDRGYDGLARAVFEAMIEATPIEVIVTEMIAKSNEKS